MQRPLPALKGKHVVVHHHRLMSGKPAYWNAIHPIDVKNRHFTVVQEMPAKYDVLGNQVVPREPRSKAAKPRMSRSDVMRLMRAKRTLTSSVALETVC